MVWTRNNENFKENFNARKSMLYACVSGAFFKVMNLVQRLIYCIADNYHIDYKKDLTVNLHEAACFITLV